ncbi:MAG TPA: hypothetical protein VGI40_20565 [Pirellulaceae bacterium]|jgi:hypothetical protein
MANQQNRNELGRPDGPQFSADVPAEEVAAWTEIDPGRFMPRRVRGSFQGRALG